MPPFLKSNHIFVITFEPSIIRLYLHVANTVIWLVRRIRVPYTFGGPQIVLSVIIIYDTRVAFLSSKRVKMLHLLCFIQPPTSLSTV